jgi:predicted DNA-binding protein YlxM (UPF0122 family)
MSILVTRSSLPPFDEYTEELRSVWDTHWLTNMGAKHKELEASLASFLDVEHLSLFTNGHLALEMVLQALELTGEVITTPFSFASTTHAIVRNGLTPVFCDIKSSDYTLDPSLLESLITEKTSAILPVHVYGNICDVEAIQKIADKYNLRVIYDAAHAFGENINIILDRETFAGISILKQYEKVMTMYRKYYQYEEIKGALRERVQKIPEEAYREAIANALIHRVWDINAHIRVAMHDNRIEIISPGGLPDGMTKEEYLEGQISILRNPIIGNIFFRLHHIERFGTGIRRINSAYSKSEIKPKFEVFDNSIKVVLPVMQKELSLSNDEKLIYNLFMGNRKLSSSEIVKHTDFGKTKVIKLLKLLVDQGYIKIEGEGRGTKYTPS